MGPREAREPNYRSGCSRKPRLRRGATSGRFAGPGARPARPGRGRAARSGRARRRRRWRARRRAVLSAMNGDQRAERGRVGLATRRRARGWGRTCGGRRPAAARAASGPRRAARRSRSRAARRWRSRAPAAPRSARAGSRSASARSRRSARSAIARQRSSPVNVARRRALSSATDVPDGSAPS